MLKRYSRVFNAVEINSSFYRPHRRATYERWAADTPDNFRFSVKMPKEITHTLKLASAEAPLARFRDEIAGLGEKLGPVLIQLPPSLAFDAKRVGDFLILVRKTFDGQIVVEPRHASWWTIASVELMLNTHRIGRVLADPPPCAEAGLFSPVAASPYYRLHGNPRMYYSQYPEVVLTALATSLTNTRSWCIFDNTAAGAATRNAFRLSEIIAH